MLPKLFNFGGPRLREEAAHGFPGGVSLSQDPGAKELLGETAGRTLKVRARTLHLVSDSEADHAYVVWGKRSGKGGATGRFESEAIVIDPWPGLAKPFLRKESSEFMKKIDTVSTMRQSTEGAEAGSFNLVGELENADPQAAGETRERIKAYLEQKNETSTAPKNHGQIAEYLDGEEGVPRRGPELLEWVLKEHATKNFIDDRIVAVDDVGTRYVDKNGKHAAFDHQDPQYLQDFVNAHRSAKGNDFYGRAFPPEAPTEDDAAGGST